MKGFKGLKRLVKLYEVMESVRSIEERRASNAVVQVDDARSRRKEIERADTRQAQLGLSRGERIHSLVTEQSAFAKRVLEQELVRLRNNRAEDYRLAIAEHQVSRIELRQVQRVVENAAERFETKAARQAQSDSDDRFLSRRAWLRTQESKRSK